MICWDHRPSLSGEITCWDSALISFVEIGCWIFLCMIRIVRGGWVRGKCKPKSGAWAGEGGMQGWVGEWGGEMVWGTHVFVLLLLNACCLHASDATTLGSNKSWKCGCGSLPKATKYIFTMYASKLQHTMNSLDPYGRKARKQHADF